MTDLQANVDVNHDITGNVTKSQESLTVLGGILCVSRTDLPDWMVMSRT